MLKYFKKSFLIFLCLSLLQPIYAMENRDISSNIYVPLATRIFPLLTTFLLYKYKQYKTNIEFQKAIYDFLLNQNQEKNFQTIKKCIENDGIDPDCRMGSNKETAFMLAAWSSNKILCNYLLENGADINSVDSNGRNSFGYLLGGLKKEPEIFDAEIFQYLLKHTNPTLTRVGYPAITPLAMMCTIENSNLIKLFIKHGLDVTQADSLGGTPLLYAVIMKNIETIKEFCHANASLNQLDKDGNTIFHEAIIQKLPKEHIRALITHARCDSYNENQKEKEWKVLAALSVLPFPKEVKYFILAELALVDDDYLSNKKLCKKLLNMGYRSHITKYVVKKINYINAILQIENKEEKTALDLLHESQDLQYIQDVKSLLNNEQLIEDINNPIENNLIYQMSFNHARLLLED